MSLAERRHHYQRMKSKFYRVNGQKQWWPQNELNAGLYAKHGKICSCWMCGNPRRKLKERTIQELKAQDVAEAQLEEAEKAGLMK